ncbi:MAG TPA: NAD(P)/FAD-dependent oxidoreductase [Vicinamibacterales bacterium]|nr:NAD(P)/FAD-dependent oxidoreductase [Vicinamibacterales bacterium]
MLDVAVVGSGPGGTAAARSLAANGWSVTIFEEHEQVGTPVHCTGVLAEDVVETLNLPASAVLNPLSTVRFVAPAGHSFDYTTATTEAVVIDRANFDAALAARALAAGARLVTSTRVVAIDPGDDAVRLTLANGEAVRARSVILACGANYAFQRRLGLGMPSTFLQSAQLELPVERTGDVEIHFGSEIAPKGFAWAVPVKRASGHFARIGVMADGDAGIYFSRMLDRVRDRWGLSLPDAAAPKRRMLPLGSVRRTFTDRVLAVGDAAGLVKPTTGGGIYYSVVSGELAAEVLASRLAAGDLSAAAMREYETRWRDRFQSEFTAQSALRFVAQRMRDSDIDALFTLALTDGILPLVRQKARFNRHRDFILALLRHQPARRALFGRFASSA